MILETIELTRFLLVIILHTSISIFFFYLAYRVLKRNRNQSTLILSGFYISEALGFIVNAIYFPLRINPIVYILYIISAFLVLFGFIFLLMFIINLLNLKKELTEKNQVIIIVIYAASILLLLNLTNGITINEKTNWTPMFSWSFLIIVYLFFTFLITIPTAIFLLKLYRFFEDRTLKRKFRYFLIGILGMIFAFYGLILYNTWNNPIFKSIWIFLVFIIVGFSGFLIYYGIGQNL